MMEAVVEEVDLLTLGEAAVEVVVVVMGEGDEDDQTITTTTTTTITIPAQVVVRIRNSNTTSTSLSSINQSISYFLIFICKTFKFFTQIKPLSTISTMSPIICS